MNKCTKQKVTIPTYAIGKAEPLPMFFEKRPYQGASGKVYPIPYVSAISDTVTDKEYDGIVLENEYIKVLLLPEIGGKINSALDKTTGYDFIYHNKVIKPAMVGLAGPWVSGGIEFNWPQHHRPTTFMPVEAEIKDGKAYIGEMDFFHQMKGMAAISVDEGRSYIKAEITVYNGTPVQHPFMWWANLSVEVNDSYKIVFPPDVEFVNDHDRRAVLEWPVAKGVYHTARPFNYGEGTDIHHFNAVQVPSSFMVAKGQSDADFVSGYESKKRCGVVTVANHHIAPGKKLWTWGARDFGAKWCGNLTDDGSRYVELMTGCYTDNQPDFTWIAPYETKKFTQYWYPIRDIGEVKSAAIDGAVNLEKNADGLFIGFCATGIFKNCVITLTENGKTVFETTADVSPEHPYLNTLGGSYDYDKLKLTVCDTEGKELVSYSVYRRGNKKPITPRKPALKPADIATNEELYLNGIHLVQYKHFAYRAEDYFAEALRRDPLDSRCNTAMGNLALERGQYETAIGYYDKAIQRLTLRNCNPYDTEPYYKKALCEFRLHKYAEAYDDAYLAVWSNREACGAYYLLAKLESRKGNRKAAIEMLEHALETAAGNLFAVYFKALPEGKEQAEALISEIDPLFFANRTAIRYAVNFAVEYMDFGMYDMAKEALTQAEECPMKHYWLAYIDSCLGDEAAAKAHIAAADGADWQEQFPARTESLEVLAYADTPMAHYYAGLIYYSKELYEEACREFELTVQKLAFAPAYRCLALGYFDHLGKTQAARECLEKAFALMPQSSRIFFELTQLYKALNLPLAERIALYEAHPELTAERDDCTLNLSVAYTVSGEYEKAREILKTHRFHTYEGGEGNLTQHHAWLQYLIAKREMAKGDYKAAEKELLAGLTFPANYGEEKNYFVNEAHLYTALAECYEQLQMPEKLAEALENAISTKGTPTVHSYFQCRAYRELGRQDAAEALAEEMLSIGEAKVTNAAINDYYGVGAPAYPPFGYDVARAHTLQGNTLRAFALAAEGRFDEAKQAAAQIEATDQADFYLYILKEIAND